MTDERTTPEPGDRCTPRTAGIPVALGGGATWLLARAGLAPMLRAVQDRVYDDVVWRRAVKLTDVMEAAWCLLRANYRLDDDETRDLLVGADPDALSRATVDALLGEDSPHLTYTMWARSALAANGLDPAAIEAVDLPNVLRHLVQTRRAVPLEDFTTVDAARGKWDSIASLARAAAPATSTNP